ncbi:MAG: hypothetical protein KGI58_03510 [Patescibacteria group bacterium]|nr:hypothetical protein [Patescibacteria group bacterium]
MEIPSFKTKEEENDFNKIRIESLDLPTRTKNALINASIRSLGGIIRKTESSLLDVEGLGLSGIEEIKKALRDYFSIVVLNAEKRQKYLESMPEIREEESKRFELENKATDNFLFENKQLNSKEDIINFFASHFELNSKDLLGKSRKQEIVFARNALIYFLRDYNNMSFVAIGRLLGGRDHTTAIHSYWEVKNNVDFIKNFEINFKEIIAEIDLIKKKKHILEEEKEVISKRHSDISLKESALRIKEISERNLKTLELYRQGLTLEAIGKEIGVTRERVRQIVKRTIIQSTVNDFISNGTVVDVETVLKGEEEKRKEIKRVNNPVKEKIRKERIIKIKTPKPYKWSREHDFCLNCKSNEFKHFQRGLCVICGNKSIQGQEREEMTERHGNKCDYCGIDREEAKLEFGRDFYLSRKTDEVFCKECFLNKTGKELGSKKKNKWKMFYNNH